MNASDTILIDRRTAEEMLHLSRNASYSILTPSSFCGKVRMSDIRNAIAMSARNGAKWGGGNLVELNGAMFGVSQRSLFRRLKTAPHFRISRKIALIEEGSEDGFLARKLK